MGGLGWWVGCVTTILMPPDLTPVPETEPVNRAASLIEELQKRNGDLTREVAAALEQVARLKGNVEALGATNAENFGQAGKLAAEVAELKNMDRANYDDECRTLWRHVYEAAIGATRTGYSLIAHQEADNAVAHYNSRFPRP